MAKSDYFADSDPLIPFRERKASLTLYHCAATYAVVNIVRDGFANRDFGYGDDSDPASVELADVPLVGAYGDTRCVVVTVPEDDALPFELRRADKSYRRFRMPADVVNRFERRLDDTES